ncbi:MAG: hypothetical protein HZA53_15290 [Planctomycetes bacterium]|nr:hypothetical protein [Planctomycetota bacterium]
MHRTVRLNQLGLGMVLENDVRTSTGMLVVPRGQEVTSSVLERLANFGRSFGIEEPLQVSIEAAPIEQRAA